MGRPTRIGTERKERMRSVPIKPQPVKSRAEVAKEWASFMKGKRAILKEKGRKKEIVTSRAAEHVPLMEKPLRITSASTRQISSVVDDAVRKARLILGGV